MVSVTDARKNLDDDFLATNPRTSHFIFIFFFVLSQLETRKSQNLPTTD